jgi:La domain
MRVLTRHGVNEPYVFFSQNLGTDKFLREHMDSEGYVPIALIAGFNKVVSLTTDLQLVTEVLRGNCISFLFLANVLIIMLNFYPQFLVVSDNIACSPLPCVTFYLHIK